MRKTVLFLLLAVTFLTPLLAGPFTMDHYNAPKDLFLRLAMLLCLLLWVKHTLRSGKIELAGHGIYAPLLGFLAVSALSLLWAENTYFAGQELLQLFIFTAVFCVSASIVRSDEAGYFLMAAFLAGVLAAGYAALQYSGIMPAASPAASLADWRFALTSTFGDFSSLAGYLIMAFLAGVSFYFSASRTWARIIMIPGLAIIYAGMLMAFSPGAITGLAAAMGFGAFFFIYAHFRAKGFFFRRKMLPGFFGNAATLLLPLILVSVLLAYPNKFHQNSVINRARGSLSWEKGLQRRATVYKSAYLMGKDRPAFGVGLGNFRYKYPAYRAQVLSSKGRQWDLNFETRSGDEASPGQFLQIWVETGYAGLALFLAIIFSIFKNGLYLLFISNFDLKKKMMILGSMSAITGFLLQGLVNPLSYSAPNTLLFWLLSGVLFGMLPEEKRFIVRLSGAGPGWKTAARIAALALVMTAGIWSVRLYASDVFVKKMVDLADSGQLDEANKAADISLLLNENSPAIIYTANYAFKRGYHRMAADSYKKAMRNYDHMSLHMALAQVYYSENLINNCIDEYRYALRLNPFSPYVRLRLARIYAAHKMYDEAKAECQFIITYNSDYADIAEEAERITRDIYANRVIDLTHGDF